MARKQAERSETGRRRNLNHILRYATTTALMLACAIAAIAAFHKTEAFLVRDARFAFNGPTEDGEESPNIKLHGIGHAPRSRVAGVFDRDYGRSIYLLPLAERRRQLLAVEWVKDASIRRTWPNRLDVYLSERQPVAFLEVPSDQPGAARLALIDEEGVILEPPVRARYHLPVLAGIRKDQSPPARRDGVRPGQSESHRAGGRPRADPAGGQSQLPAAAGEVSRILPRDSRPAWRRGHARPSHREPDRSGERNRQCSVGCTRRSGAAGFPKPRRPPS
ncbi:MAG: FtsQ-type POTRA domain-containing protein [Acidobacteria bacterium]|nr:FtsQ-type POTRA domain-containing protein [Acidobacteriota bacterium]